MKLPRDLSSREVIHALSKFGYRIVRQTGSHIRLTTTLVGEHHLTVPAHDPVKVGTLRVIVGMVAIHFKKTRQEMTDELFG